LLKTGFFRQVKGAENTKEKSRQCFNMLWKVRGFRV
jgi:predicted adenine nucleotide alpha hydrolase (AANH) superfamily ATPase